RRRCLLCALSLCTPPWGSFNSLQPASPATTATAATFKTIAHFINVPFWVVDSGGPWNECECSTQVPCLIHKRAMASNLPRDCNCLTPQCLPDATSDVATRK